MYKGKQFENQFFIYGLNICLNPKYEKNYTFFASASASERAAPAPAPNTLSLQLGMRLSFVLYFSSTNSFFTTFVINIGFKIKVSVAILYTQQLKSILNQIKLKNNQLNISELYYN